MRDMTLIAGDEDAPARRRRWQSGRRRPALALASPDTGRRRGFRRTGGLWLVLPGLVLGVLAVLIVTHLPPAPPGPPQPVVVASMPYWNIDHGTGAVLANEGDVNEVSPWVYGLDAGGDIVNQYPASQDAAITGDIGRLRAAGLRIVPTLANVVAGDFAYQPIGSILHNSARTARHVAAIVDLVVRNHYTGIDIDYEDLHAGDRHAFTAFLRQLATALHAHHKILSAALFAKTTDAGVDPRNVAQDYAAIGAVADQVRLMGYDYHWASSPPGPIAPLTWIKPVLAYARSQIAARKIVLGVPMYGYDWAGGHGTAVTWLQAFRLANQYHARPRFDKRAQAPWFTYTDGAGRAHTVWFENTASVTAKLDIARGSGIAGVYLWLYGYEDTGVWPALRRAFPITAPSPGSTGRSDTAGRPR